MKKVFLHLSFLLIFFPSFAQIDPFLGIYAYDSCDFEVGLDIVLQDSSPTNLWQIGLPQKSFLGTAYSAPYAIITDTISPYLPNNHSFFDLKIPSMYWLGMIVGFQHKYQTDSLRDGGYIEVSYDKGQNWVNVLDDEAYLIFNSENLYGDTDTLAGGIKGFSGSTSEWVHTQIQWIWGLPVRVSSPLDLTDTLMLRFHFISDSIDTQKEGWLIDNIMISYADLGSAIDKAQLPPLPLFPNPASQEIEISLPENIGNQTMLSVYSILGEVLKTAEVQNTNSVHLNVADLPSGTYILQIRDPKKLVALQKFEVK